MRETLQCLNSLRFRFNMEDHSSSEGTACTRGFLPADIVALVVDHFRQDAKTLSQLSLVSREWVHPSQCHLFSSFRIQATVSECSSQLVNLVQNLEPRLALFVRKLTIEAGQPFITKERPRFYSQRRPADVDLTLLFSVIQKLPYLHTLVLNACTLSGPDTSDTPCITHPLHSLSLMDVSGQTASFNALLSSIPISHSFQMLDAMVGSCLDKPEPQPMFHPSLSKVDRLLVESNSQLIHYRLTGELYTQLLSMPSTLAHLDVGSMLSNDVMRDGMLSLIKERGHSLKHLRLDLSYVRRKC